MLSMTYRDSFHNKSYETFGIAWPGPGAGLPPQGVGRVHVHNPSLVAARNSRRYE